MLIVKHDVYILAAHSMMSMLVAGFSLHVHHSLLRSLADAYVPTIDMLKQY
jgi:hypothetical protein